MAGESIYRDHGELYARFCERSAPNAQYDRPTILSLTGDIAGKRVLELGCAGGVLTAQLADRGADVLAIDREPQLVELARRRLADRARIEVTDLEQPLRFVPPRGIDVVVASLVLHYVEGWGPLLAGLHRCLVPGGRLVFSVHRVHRRGIQMLLNRPDHQPHRMIGRQPLPHVRWQQERLIPPHRPVALRHATSLPEDHLSRPKDTPPGKPESATARPPALDSR